jgi:hypothetical protein
VAARADGWLQRAAAAAALDYPADAASAWCALAWRSLAGSGAGEGTVASLAAARRAAECARHGCRALAAARLLAGGGKGALRALEARLQVSAHRRDELAG